MFKQYQTPIDFKIQYHNANQSIRLIHPNYQTHWIQSHQLSKFGHLEFNLAEFRLVNSNLIISDSKTKLHKVIKLLFKGIVYGSSALNDEEIITFNYFQVTKPDVLGESREVIGRFNL